MTAERVRLTAPRVAAFECPPERQQAFLWDDEVPGLALRCTRAGAKAFIFERRLHGANLRVTIGGVAAHPLPKARERARELQRQIDQGLDPRVQAREQEQQAKAERAKAKLKEAPALEAWHAYCNERQSAWGERNHADHIKLASPGGVPRKRAAGVTMPGALHGLLQLPLSQITPAAIEKWAALHAKARPATARLCLRLLSVFLNWCRVHPEYAHVLAGDSNPAKSRKARETLGPAKAKTDSLQREQLAPWFAQVRQLDPVVSAYLQVLLLCGARPGELLGLRWQDVDFTWRSLAIHDKVEGERIIPLVPYCCALLAALPRRGPWVFMSGKAEGPIASPNHALHRACKLAGIPAVTLHGLRRSFGSLCEWTETPSGIVAQIMGHKPSATAEKHYRVRPLDLLRQWHTKIEGWILEQAGIEQPGEQDAAQRLRVVA